MGSYYTNSFLTFPLCSLIHIPETETFPGTPNLCLLDHSKRGEASEVETWVAGVAAILYSFIGLSELRNPKCHVGKGVRVRSLGLCSELGLKPGHSATYLTRLLTRISASILLKELNFSTTCSFIYLAPLLPSTYDGPGAVG